MNRRFRRLAAVTALAMAGPLAVAIPAQAATVEANSYAYTAGRWLEDQLTNGVIIDAQWSFANYGTSLDVFFTLRELGIRPSVQSQVIDAVSADPSAYVGAAPELYAGAHGKLVTALVTAGQDPTDVGPGNADVLAGLESLVAAATGPDQGRASDQSEWGDYSSTITQAWVVRGLAGAGSSLTDEAVSYLGKQQCANGGFRSALADTQCTTGEASVDSTAFAIEGLLAATAAGEPDLSDAVSRASAWLASAQAADGSFVEANGVPNANSTGLAGQALAKTGKPGAAGNAAAWVLGNLVTAKTAEGTSLSTEIGAIAYDDEALADGKVDGITSGARGQWQIATSQSALALSALLPAKSLGLTMSSGSAQTGQVISGTVSGLAAGERFTARWGTSMATGVAAANGSATFSIKLPSTAGVVSVTATGSRANRTASQAVTVQAPAAAKPTTPAAAGKKFKVTYKKKKVKRYAKQTVTIKGLKAKETVVVKYGKKTIKKGKANSKGVVKVTFKVGKTKGKTRVTVVGSASNRTGSAPFWVK